MSVIELILVVQSHLRRLGLDYRLGLFITAE
jgi:hypothetical protein